MSPHAQSQARLVVLCTLVVLSNAALQMQAIANDKSCPADTSGAHPDCCSVYCCMGDGDYYFSYVSTTVKTLKVTGWNKAVYDIAVDKAKNGFCKAACDKLALNSRRSKRIPLPTTKVVDTSPCRTVMFGLAREHYAQEAISYGMQSYELLKNARGVKSPPEGFQEPEVWNAFEGVVLMLDGLGGDPGCQFTEEELKTQVVIRDGMLAPFDTPNVMQGILEIFMGCVSRQESLTCKEFLYTLENGRQTRKRVFVSKKVYKPSSGKTERRFAEITRSLPVFDRAISRCRDELVEKKKKQEEKKAQPAPDDDPHRLRF